MLAGAPILSLQGLPQTIRWGRWRFDHDGPTAFHQPCVAWPYGGPVRSCVCAARGCAVTPVTVDEVRGRGQEAGVQGP